MMGGGLGLSEWGWWGRNLPLNHVCTFAPGLHRNFGKSANEDAGDNVEDSGIGEVCTEICTDQDSTLHHLHRKRRASLQGRVARLRVPVKPAVVQTSRRSLSVSGGSGKWAHYRVICDANQGANRCKGVNPANPGGRDRPRGTLRRKPGSKGVAPETCARIRRGYVTLL